MGNTGGGKRHECAARWTLAAWAALLLFLPVSGVGVAADGGPARHPLFAGPAVPNDGWRSGFTNATTADIWALAVDPATGEVYVGGQFVRAGGQVVNHIAKWNGSTWSPLGTGMDGDVLALAVDARGNVYAGGNFTTAGGWSASFVAKWDGNTWTNLGTGTAGTVLALAVDAFGNVYAGGGFSSAGETQNTACLAVWDGHTWSSVGGGLTQGSVNALAVEGSGIVYVGGFGFTATGVGTVNVAKWNGTRWSALGGDLDGPVFSLKLDGAGNVYAGGFFAQAGTLQVNGIAKWDLGTSTWVALGAGVGRTTSLALDAQGDLYAGGDFTTAGGSSGNCVAKWDGIAWSALGTGMDSAVLALAVGSDGSLLAGGDFIAAGGKLSIHFGQWRDPPPVSVTQVTPSIGPASGGRVVTVTGSGLATTGSVTVTFGGHAASAVTLNTSTQLVCTTPAHSTGTVDVVVTNPDGWQGTCPGGYDYVPAPAISSVSPDHGPATLAKSVTIGGSAFLTGATVTFGGTAATNVSVVTATQITCTAPTHAPGTVSVVVMNPDAQSGSSSYTYDPGPTVISLTPTHGPATLTQAVTIAGSNFVGTPGVTFGGNPATGVSATATQITCTAPTGAPGTAAVVVTNPDGQIATSSYTYDEPPSLSEVSPNHGPMTRTTPATISGRGFGGQLSVLFGTRDATDVNVVDGFTITCTAPRAWEAGQVSVWVESPDWQYPSLAGLFVYDAPPEITSLEPDHGPATLPCAVTIQGSHFVGTPAVTFGGHPATGVSATATQITCTAPTGSGTVSVVVTNADEQSASSSYTYDPAPSITGLSPSHGPATLTTLVSINGSNFVSVSSVTFGGISAVSYTGGTSLVTCTAPTGSGTVSVVVTNGDGQTASSSYTYDPAPSITGLSPSHGPATFTSPVSINGGNFASVSSVTFGGNPATGVSNTATQVTCTAPTGSGSVSVVVTNGDGRTASSSYTYDPAPSIASIVPAHGPATLLNAVTIAGGNFVGTPGVTFAGHPATDVSATATQITCTAPTGAPGTAAVVVRNPDGQTASGSYTYDFAPSISGLAPTHGPATFVQALTIYGDYFVGIPAVTFNGNPATGISATATVITCTAPTGSGSVSLVVTNPDGQSGSANYTYDSVPSITSLNPAHGPATLTEAVTINGSYFVATPSVTFDGNPATGISATATRITCLAPTGAPGTVAVVVTNPDGQTASSSYTYDPAPSISAIAPAHGPATLVQAVTISGDGFVGTPSVTFDGTDATSVAVVSATEITCLAPTGLPGTAAVVVTNPDGQTASCSYTYDPAPSLSGIAPTHGPATLPQALIIYGNYFVGTPGVTFGGQAATNVSATATQIACTAPTGAPGTAAVVVTNLDGQTASCSYTYDPAPGIASIVPAHGPATLLNAVTITGSNFVGTPGVTFGGNPAADVSATATQITCTAPTGAPGTAAVVVTNPDGQTASGSYTYDFAPSLSGLVPTHGPATFVQALTIYGYYFAGTPAVTFGGNPATDVSATIWRITCTAPTGSGSVSLVVTNPDGQSGSANYTYDPVPGISSIAPAHGPATLTEAVTIDGDFFVGTPGVTFDGNPATGVSATSTRITCLAPTGAPGTVAVVVTNPDGQTASSSYTYDPAPSIRAIAPAHGPATLVQAVTISGNYFVGTPSVTFDGTDATSVAVVSATEITCLAPTGVPGAAAVVVTNPDGQTASCSYTYDPPPSLSGIAPTHGPATLPQALIIYGNYFVGTPGVTFGGQAATNVSATATQIACTAPTGTPGTAAVVVTNLDGQTASCSYTYDPAPSIASIVPAHGPATLASPVTITGSNFVGTPGVTFGGNPAGGVSATATQITCTAPTGAPGTAAVVVTNPDGQTASGSYTYDFAPSISGLVPTHGPATFVQALTIYGDYFVGIPAVTFGGNPATGISATATVITCTAPTGAPGAVPVVVINPDGQSASWNYTYDPAPSVSGVSPAHGPATLTNAVTINGNDFSVFVWVTFDGHPATYVTATATQVACTAPTGTPGTVAVVVTNLDGQTGSGTYTYDPAPSIRGISPAHGPATLVQAVTISGDAFVATPSVTFDGTDATSVAVLSATEITCLAPTGLPGTAAVVVTNPDGQTDSGSYTYDPAPGLTGVVPSHGPATIPTAVTLTGTGFVTGATVTFDGTVATNASVVSTTQIVCTTPTHAAGTVSVVVTNPDNQTASGSYTYDPPPSIRGIAPAHGPATLPIAVTITGTNFVTTPTVTFAGNTASVVSVTGTQITCTAPTGTPGTVSVVVTNPDGQTASTAYTYDPLPTVTNVSPASGPSTGATAVTVTGTGFLAGAAVDFGGSLATNVTVSDGTITCTTTSHALGTVRVTVTNTDTQSGFLDSAYAYLNVAPVIESQPWADPAMVVLPATSTLRVVANDPDNAPAPITYTWEKVAGPGTVTFSRNGDTVASTTTASFSSAGTYGMIVSLYDGAAYITSDTLTVIAENPGLAASVKGDLTGDGNPDIILQDYAAGTLTVWPMNGSGGYDAARPITSGGTPVQMGANSGGWTLVGCGDFNNDGQQDLVFQNIPAGQVQVWLMARLAVTTILPLRRQGGNMLNLGANSSGWQVAACDDFKGDGRPEILLQNYASGELTVWTVGGGSYMGSLSITNSVGQPAYLGANSAGWRVAGSGDFNSDGKADLLFHNVSSGTFCIWYLNRTAVSGSAWLTNGNGPMNLGANSGGWTVGACADYTRDGKCDVVLQNTGSGAITLWAMDGAAYAHSITIRDGAGATVKPGGRYSGGWTFAGCGDINADGTDELFWQHTATGALSAWNLCGYNYMDSMSILNASGQLVGLGANSGGWRAVGFADFNGDGKQDLLMQNDAQGQVCVWFLNHNTYTGSAMLTAPNGQVRSLGANSNGWRVVGAADFNGDGKPDLLLQNDAQGLFSIWWLNGTVFTGSAYVTDSSNSMLSLGTNSGGWRAACCGDLDGDGRPEVLLQNDAQGLATVWSLDGSKFLWSGLVAGSAGDALDLGTDSAGWRVVGSGDMNGDGRCEILSQNLTDGYIRVGVLNGLTYTDCGMILDPNGYPVTPNYGEAICAPR